MAAAALCDQDRHQWRRTSLRAWWANAGQPTASAIASSKAGRRSATGGSDRPRARARPAAASTKAIPAATSKVPRALSGCSTTSGSPRCSAAIRAATVGMSDFHGQVAACAASPSATPARSGDGRAAAFIQSQPMATQAAGKAPKSWPGAHLHHREHRHVAPSQMAVSAGPAPGEAPVRAKAAMATAPSSEGLAKLALQHLVPRQSARWTKAGSSGRRWWSP
jgi:hypothetical protein